ncbi:hypothetical protein FZI91_07300 [Mycobacterium sp. CBMA271]|uniref:hypothetical protein n=1 Tax=unclassified Mycobacteroides TaxID=2618759 RepID=UPI001325D2EE|nr:MULTISPECIES: hypothetical protein [unclassified Mycobacteroides]MUM21511.1 hypothetical protein [Mycobacteroides sp. CBMA 271]
MAAAALSAAFCILAPGVANAVPLAPTPKPAPGGTHDGQLLQGGEAPSEAQQPRDEGGGWVDHPGGTGPQCMDRGVVCRTGIWYPDRVQSQHGQSEWVQMPDETGAECENEGVVCGNTAS